MMLNFYKADEKNIAGLQDEKEGGTVKIRGFVESVKNKDGYAAIELAELRTVSVIVFTQNNISIGKNEKLEIIGEIRNYKGKNEVIAEEIRRI